MNIRTAFLRMEIHLYTLDNKTEHSLVGRRRYKDVRIIRKCFGTVHKIKKLNKLTQSENI